MKSNKFWTVVRKTMAVTTVMLIVTLVLVSSSAGQAKYKNLHTFTHTKAGYAIGGRAPDAGLIFDAAGNLYGTTERGGANKKGCGTVFELSPKPDGRWSETVLYSFLGRGDGCRPHAAVTFDMQGNLYGTTERGTGGRCPDHGGNIFGCGTVFKLTANPDGSWSHTVLYDFGSGTSSGPSWRQQHKPYAGLIFDAAGNLYGTTTDHWRDYYGTVFKLTPNPDGSWTESVIYTMASSSVAGLTFDAAGSLYGTTISDVFKLTPKPDGTWTPNVLYTFTGGADGGSPYAGLVFDAAGNLYGTTVNGGTYGYGVVFQLTPKPDGSWTETVLHQFTGGKDGSNPYDTLSFNNTGDLYGTASSGGAYGYGVVFKLALARNGKWQESVVHAFNASHGANSIAGVIFDAAGSLYGTTVDGGAYGYGNVFEITP